MPVVRKTPTKTASVRAKAPAQKATPVKPPDLPVSSKAVENKEKTKAAVVGSPETKEASGHKRKRLSKAFSRPLDKKLKQKAVVRDCFTFPEVEYAYLVGLKKRLLADGVEIKKSELLRAGLVLLSSLDDEDLKVLLAKVPRVD